MDNKPNISTYNFEKLISIKTDCSELLGDSIVATIYEKAEEIANSVVTVNDKRKVNWDKKLDDILTSKLTGYPIMLILLGIVFWITIEGANYPSQMLSNILFALGDKLSSLFMYLSAPDW